MQSIKHILLFIVLCFAVRTGAQELSALQEKWQHWELHPIHSFLQIVPDTVSSVPNVAILKTRGSLKGILGKTYPMFCLGKDSINIDVRIKYKTSCCNNLRLTFHTIGYRAETSDADTIDVPLSEEWTEHTFVLRYTNFVEMMLPCFSKEALHKVIGTFNENESGWGTEFHWPLLIETNGRDMAIIDSVPMVHTRPVKRGRNENVKELEAYLKKYSLAPHVKELDFVIENISADSRSKMKVLNERRKVLIKAFAGVVPVLLRKLNMKEISRQGLDGKLSIALYLKLLADFTESVYYKNIAKELFNHIKSRKECSKTLHSFVSGSLGEQWAAYWLQRENSIFKFIKGAIPGNNNELKELETVLDCRIEDLLYVPVSKIMLRVSEYQKNYKPSDNNVMLHSIWGQMHVLYQIEVQMLKLKDVKKNMSLPY